MRSTAENYRRFAHLEARGRSLLYEELAAGVADDFEVLAHIDSLPEIKRQPNLLLGAFRYLYGTAQDYPAFRSTVIRHWDELSATVLRRRTQTNEVARCATLLPLLVALPQPLALFEVGASAGLCLLPDRYRYDYGNGAIGPRESAVVLQCERRGAETPVPDRLPEVAWRSGCDLDPISVQDDDEVRWLEALIWPGEGDRLARLRSAVEIARDADLRISARDLRDGIADLVEEVPNGATLVIFHSAVLAYVRSGDRSEFVAEVTRLGAQWIANEDANVLPDVAGQLREDERTLHRGDFLLSLNGAPIAWTDPHGTWVQWRADCGLP
jgi:hypothetical protein